MDASAPSTKDANISEVFGCPATFKQKSTSIKYTKIPDFVVDAQWAKQRETNPRLRRITELHDTNLQTTRSLKNLPSGTLLNCSPTTCKIITISENNECDRHPKFYNQNVKILSKSTSTNLIENHMLMKNLKIKISSRSTHINKNDKLNGDQKFKFSSRSTSTNINENDKFMHSENNEISIIPNSFIENNKVSLKNSSKDPQTKNTQIDLTSQVNIRKKLRVSASTESGKATLLSKEKLNREVVSLQSSTEKVRPKQHVLPNRTKLSVRKENKVKRNPVTFIRIPPDSAPKGYAQRLPFNDSETNYENISQRTVYTAINTVLKNKDADVNTDSPCRIDEYTETDLERTNDEPKKTEHKEETTKTFDNLDIPNVTLMLDRNDISKDEIVKFQSTSLPSLRIPSVTITSSNEKNCSLEKNPIDCTKRKSTSFIIGRATLTYTTKQKINFHVVSNKETLTPSLTPSPLAYPFNVVSVFKKEIKKTQTNDVTHFNEKSKTENTQLSQVNCSYVLNKNKLMKPSEIIGTIRLNNSLLENDYICQQFQNELNFIDSFFESLQYLESSDLAQKCFSKSKCEKWISDAGFDVENLEYESFLSKFENGEYDTETMASKSLCLLNLLIRDEQRRAKNLLFVLKMRENALKDFTKSQILWLENKKKQENTDISTLKKKQRGALLKLQHECGEMQRMRKALLALSEKRKAALIKTKKDIELKSKNSLEVDQILKEKRKLKRSLSSERVVAPIKCFELSSSGCDDIGHSKKTEKVEPVSLHSPEIHSSSLNCNSEKSIQTGESILGSLLIDQSAGTDDISVAVDGGYLNILFSNLSLPQIFASGKQYEVNEEALKNIVNTAITHHKINENEVDNFMEKLKTREEASSPSTARSLVEELDQYYKNLNVDECSDKYYDAEVWGSGETPTVFVPNTDSHTTSSNSTGTSISGCTIITPELEDTDDDYAGYENGRYIISETTQSQKGKDIAVVGNQTGPLPVPVGASADSPEDEKSFEFEYVADTPVIPSVPSLSPVHSEAEELRRQQLAIEREIKALEQQQSQLLVVREIPDKPPPPYKPPQDTKLPKPARIFHIDATTDDKIEKLVTQPQNAFIKTSDTFELFLNDFCEESVRRQTCANSEKPWDACNLLPKKPKVDSAKLVQKTSMELKEVLKGVTPVSVSGVTSRRSDHIDDILFTEWRRCEPEWTSLHTDEAIVKNQVFESIFQKVLSETIDEYKKTVFAQSFE